jgi:hypothetical protein
MRLIAFFLACIFALPLQAFEDGFDDVKMLTDEEQMEANDYYHSGLAEKHKTEECAENGDLCTNQESGFKSKGMQTMEMMAPMISQAYSMILGGSTIKMASGGAKTVTGGANKGNWTPAEGGGYESTQLDAKGNVTTQKMSEEDMGKLEESGNAEDKTEEAQDYCVYIPTATELASQAFQTMSQDNIEQQYEQTDPSAKQKASLESVKQAQETRAKTATVQTIGWGATGACYIGYAIAGGYTDWKLYAKIGATALLATFYGFKIAAHKQRAEDIQDIIDGFPKAGDCNPHTETTCFCTEPSSATTDPQNFQKACMPPALANRFNADPFVCVNAKGQTDAECKCKQSNTCIDYKLKSGFASLGLNPSSLAGPLKALEPVTKGTGAGELGAAHNKNMAMARKFLKNNKPSKVPNFRLSPKQKKLAKAMTKMGIPAIAAAAIASQPVKATPAGGAMAGLRGGSMGGSFKNKKIREAFKKSNMRFAGSRRGRSSLRSRSKRKSRGRGAKGGSGGSVTIVDDLKRKAASRAEINRNSGKNIFDIITYRYNVSAWKRFEEQIQKEINPGKAPEKKE